MHHVQNLFSLGGFDRVGVTTLLHTRPLIIRAGVSAR